MPLANPPHLPPSPPGPSRRGVRHAPPGVSVEVEYVVLLRPYPFSSPATPGWTVVETKLGRERWQTDRFIYTKESHVMAKVKSPRMAQLLFTAPRDKSITSLVQEAVFGRSGKEKLTNPESRNVWGAFSTYLSRICPLRRGRRICGKCQMATPDRLNDTPKRIFFI
jgi:hypothetical protein